MARAFVSELNLLPPALEAIANQLAKLAPRERQAVVRAAENRTETAKSALRPVKASLLLAKRGLVALGGNALEDTQALYDG